MFVKAQGMAPPTTTRSQGADRISSPPPTHLLQSPPPLITNLPKSRSVRGMSLENLNLPSNNRLPLQHSHTLCDKSTGCVTTPEKSFAFLMSARVRPGCLF